MFTSIYSIIGGTIAIVLLSVIGIIHVICATSVSRLANWYRAEIEENLLLMPRWAWLLFALIFGVLAGTIFWLIHCSNLNPLTRRFYTASEAIQ